MGKIKSRRAIARTMARVTFSSSYGTARECDLTTTSGVPQPNSMIQVDKVMSELNHRLYRQHMVYTARVSLGTDAQTNQIDVYALAPTWYVLNSLRTAKRVHDDAMKEERALVRQARWYDFRIRPDMPLTEVLQPAGLTRTTLGLDAVSNTGSEYLYSEIHDLNGNNKRFQLVGASSAGAFNVFEEYDAMGNVSDSPQTPAPGGYDDVDSDINNANADDLQQRGNAPPYDTDTWNVVWVKVGELYRTASGTQSVSTGYFDAPLGIIYIPNYAQTTNGVLRLDVKAGKYKGIQAVAL